MSDPVSLSDRQLRDRAVAAARGDEPFDLLICGAAVADLVLGELRPADVGITGPMISSVHPPGELMDTSEILDGSSMILVPGFIDTHMHIESSMVAPSIYAAAVVPRGVTTVVWDPHEFGNVSGLDAMEHVLEEAARSPLRILVLAPSCVPSAPGYETSGADFTPDVIAGLLRQPGIAGLAEVMDMSGVIRRENRLSGIVQTGLESGKLVCGHARGLSGRQLQAYAAAGIGSDHELTSSADMLEKLRAGLTIELRGSHPYLLPEIAQALQNLPACPPTLTLCTDDVFPDDLLDRGGLNEVLRLLVLHGLEPLRALQAATLNASIRLGRPDLGLVAPGRRADLVLLRDLESFEAARVLCNGQPPEFDRSPCRSFGATAWPGSPRPSDFEIAARGPIARVATIDQPRFTKLGERRVTVVDGHLAPPDDVTRIAVLHRKPNAGGRPRVGFLTGWGSWNGAFATTVSHDSHNLTVFGNNCDDMAQAANALIQSGGGMAVVQGGKTIAALPLPVAGLVSEEPLATVAAGFREVRAAMDNVVGWEPPYLVFKALVGATLACNPGPHQTDLGIADPAAAMLLASPLLEDGLSE